MEEDEIKDTVGLDFTAPFIWVRQETTGEIWAENWCNMTHVLKGQFWLLCGQLTAGGQELRYGEQLGGYCNSIGERWRCPVFGTIGVEVVRVVGFWIYFDGRTHWIFCGFDIRYEREEKRDRDNSKVWSLTNRKKGSAISWDGEGVVLEERMQGFCFGQVKYMVPVRQPSGNVKWAVGDIRLESEQRQGWQCGFGSPKHLDNI